MAIKVYERGAYLYFALEERDLSASFLGNFEKTENFWLADAFEDMVDSHLRSADNFTSRVFFRLPTSDLSTAGLIRRL